MKGLSHAANVDEIIAQVLDLEQKLSDFEQKLPPNLKFVDRNLYNHASTSERITFIMIQSWWYECHCNLYRFSIPGFRESKYLSSQNEAFALRCRRQLVHWAIAQSSFWRSVAQMEQIFVSDPHVVVLVYSNTKVLLAARKFQDLIMDEGKRDLDVDEVTTLLTSNVSFMDKLAKKVPWVSAAVSISDPSLLPPRRTNTC